jgi:DNA-binding response OmpR family regulator
MTADHNPLTKLHCLQKGADILLKPFDTEELLLRCRHLLSDEKTKPLQQSFPKQLSLDHQLRRVFHHGDWLMLNCKEFLILEALLNHPNQPISREILLSKVWVDDDKALFSNSLETYIASLRRKLGRKLIKTIRGKGYALILEK